jgi:hypothetical protein
LDFRRGRGGIKQILNICVGGNDWKCKICNLVMILLGGEESKRGGVVLIRRKNVRVDV